MQGHDNDAAKGSGANNSGASSPEGGIFSTPSLTINTENLPKEFTSGTVSIGATSDASPSSTNAQPFSFSETSPEAPSSPSSSGAALTTPRSNTFNSTATGDIKLKPSGKKKSKLPVFIAIIVLVAALGTGAFLLLRRVGGDGATTASEASLEEAQRAFARYANYLLYGEEGDALEGEYNPSQTYELDRQLNNSDPEAEYWKKAGELLNTAIETYGRVEGKSIDVAERLGTNKGYFSLLNTYRQMVRITLSDAILLYDSAGEEDAQAQIFNTIKIFKTSTSEVDVGYYNIQSQRLLSLLTLSRIYIEYGCVRNGEINRECINSVDDTDESDEFISAANTNATSTMSAVAYVSQVKRQLLSDSWWIYSQISSEVEATE